MDLAIVPASGRRPADNSVDDSVHKPVELGATRKKRAPPVKSCRRGSRASIRWVASSTEPMRELMPASAPETQVDGSKQRA